MAITITSITRVNPAPCQHFTITGAVDGNAFSRMVHANDLPTDEEVPLREAILRIMRYYNEVKGVGLNGFVGKVILPDTLADAP